MGELVWMGNSADSIDMYLVEECVMRSCLKLEYVTFPIGILLSVKLIVCSDVP